METAETLLKEFDNALSFEKDRIDGYTSLLAINQILTSSTRDAVKNALAWSQERYQLLTNAQVSVVNIVEHGYPNREIQFVDKTVIDELTANLNDIELAIKEFITPLTVESTVSEEIKVS